MERIIIIIAILVLLTGCSARQWGAAAVNTGVSMGVSVVTGVYVPVEIVKVEEDKEW